MEQSEAPGAADALAGAAGTSPTRATGTPGAPPTEPPAPAPARRRRRWLRRTVAALSAVALLAVAGTLGGGWYFSSELLRVDHSVTDPVTVVAVSGSEVTLSRDADTARPVRFGLTWNGGHALLSAAVRPAGNGVVRTVTEVVRGALRPGLRAHLDTFVFAGDPETGRGLPFTDVAIHDEGGDASAWYVPPAAGTARTTWVIAVHGRGSTRQEALRILPTIAAAGAPTLDITYRNDVGAPRSPDGYYHLGDTEWRDVAAAIRYARDHGATGVILYGWSMGGALVMTTVRRLPAADAALVRGAVLDSPVLDWTATLDLQASERSLPGFLTWTAERVVEQRAHLSLGDFDQVSRARSVTTPILLFVDRSDATVPPGPSLRFAAARPDLVTLVTTSGGDHTRSWNVDPQRYESAVRTFLAARA